MQDHRKLKVWQRAQEKCVEVYLFTADFPVEERYGMTAQLRKAAVSLWAPTSPKARRVSPKWIRLGSSISRKARPLRPCQSLILPSGCDLGGKRRRSV